MFFGVFSAYEGKIRPPSRSVNRKNIKLVDISFTSKGYFPLKHLILLDLLILEAKKFLLVKRFLPGNIGFFEKISPV